MKLWIDNRQTKQKIRLRTLRRITKEILDVLGSPDAELSLSFVTDQEIKEINRKHLHRSRPTDVLSFSMREGEFHEINPLLLGDVIISTETAQKQANEKGHSLEEEIWVLLIHGILHLLGYNHELDESNAKTMQEKEKSLFLLIKDKFMPSSDGSF